MLFVDRGIPEDDTHILAFGLFESKDQGVVEVGPEILGLDVCEKDVRIHGKTDAETEAFPRKRRNDSRGAWDS